MGLAFKPDALSHDSSLNNYHGVRELTMVRAKLLKCKRKPPATPSRANLDEERGGACHAPDSRGRALEG
jgi:hypothetical protein